MLLASSPGPGARGGDVRFNLRPLRHKNVAAPSAHALAPTFALRQLESDYKLQMKLIRFRVHMP